MYCPTGTQVDQGVQTNSHSTQMHSTYSHAQEDHEIFDLVSAVEKSEGQPRAASSASPNLPGVPHILSFARQGHDLLLLARRPPHCVHRPDRQGLQEEELAAAVSLSSSSRLHAMTRSWRQPRQEQGRQGRARAVCATRSSRGHLEGFRET